MLGIIIIALILFSSRRLFWGGWGFWPFGGWGYRRPPMGPMGRPMGGPHGPMGGPGGHMGGRMGGPRR